MESHEVIKRAVDRVGAKKAAQELNVSASLMYKWCEPQGDADASESGSRNPLDRVLALYRATGEESVLGWLCRQADGCFVKDAPPAPEKIDQEYLARTRQLISEFSDLLRVLSESMADDSRIDRREAARIRDTWTALKSHGEGFVRACEGGVYADGAKK